MTEAEALLAWISNEHECIGGAADDDLRHKILKVGQVALSKDDDCSLDVLTQELGIGSNASNEQLMAALLDYALDENRNANYTTYAEGFGELSGPVQLILVGVVKQQRGQTDSEPHMTTSGNDEAQVIMEEAAEESTVCRSCTDTAKRIEHLQNEFKERAINFSAEINKLKSDIADQTEKTTNAELDAITKDSKIHELQTQLSAAHQENDKLRALLSDNTRVKEELARAQEELELRPTLDDLEKERSKLERALARLEEHMGAEKLYQQEYDKHTATVSELNDLKKRCELLEEETKDLAQTQSDLVAITIERDELQLRLNSEEARNAEFAARVNSLEGGQQGSLQQTRMVASELQETQAELLALRRTGGIGLGMSEMNSDLMRELSELKEAKASLEAKLDKASLDNAARLERELKKSEATRESLQKQLFQTKEELALALATIDALRGKLARLQADHRELTDRLADASALAEEDVLAQQQRSSDNMAALRQEHSQAFTASCEQYEGVIADTTAKLDHCEAVLADKLAVIETLTAEGLDKDGQISGLSADLSESRAEREREAANFVEELDAQKRSFEAAMAQQTAESESQIDQLNESSKRKIATVTAELEQEGSKRRRMERMNNAEISRLKIQVQHAMSSGGSGGGDVDSALKELKAMQEQLDEAHRELAHLRSLAAAAGDATMALEAAPTASSRPVTRAVRVKQGAVASRLEDKEASATGGGSAAAAAQGSIYSYAGLVEQQELSEKKIEQLNRERREMLAKSLEENKEKQEISQKLLASEKEVVTLKSEVRTLKIEKGRIERELLKKGDVKALVNNENVPNGARVV